MSMKPCVDCGQPVSTKAPRCPNCGLKDPTTSPDNSPLLFSATSPGGRVVRCRECGGSLRSTAKSCPICGVKTPVRRSLPRWVIVTAVLILALPAVGMMGWRMATNYLVAGLDSGMVRSRASPVSEVPRFRATGFPAQCLSPAPVFVYVIGSMPSDLRVFLNARDDAEGNSVTRALAKKYDLHTHYRSDRRTFDVNAKPDLVGKLRCESGVKSIEQKSRPTTSY
jgi:RNA polymerase subunit RPABC4/transcription elongation factor Spt4